MTKSLGDAENTQVIRAQLSWPLDVTTSLKFTNNLLKMVDIENATSQIVHQYDPTKEDCEKPNQLKTCDQHSMIGFNFNSLKLEGRALRRPGEFSFVLKDEKGNVIESKITNDSAGENRSFSRLKRGEGTHLYHVEEINGTDSGIEWK